jgi:hypothetical protein
MRRSCGNTGCEGFVWEPAARADLRRLDRETAMHILLALTNHGESGEGDVKRLTDREGSTGFGLESGGCSSVSRDVTWIHGIDNRGQAY